MRPRKLVGNSKTTTSFDIKQQSKRMEDRLMQLKSIIKKQKDEKSKTQRWSSQETPKPVEKQQQPTSQLYKFLQSLNLSQHQPLFLKAGVDTIQILKQLTKQHMEEIGIPKGHVLKIMKYLGDAKAEQIRKTQEKPIKSEETTKQPTIKQATQQFNIQTQQIERQFCQKCYKPFFIESYSKYCSDECQRLCHQEDYTNCKKCQKHTKKWDCFKAQEDYYCTQQCLMTLLKQQPEQVEPEKDIFYELEEEEEADIDMNEFLEMQRYLRS